MAACLVDADCPGTRLCFVDVPWSEQGALCECNTMWGFAGPECDELGATAWFLVGSAGLQAIVALVFAIQAIGDVARLVLRFRASLRSVSPSPAIFWIVLALLSHATWRGFAIAVVFTPLAPPAQDRAVAGSPKLVGLAPPMRVAIVITQCAAFLACTTTSVIWLRNAKAADRVRARGLPRVSRYGRAVLVTQVLFAGAMVLVSALGYFAWTGVVSAPFLGFLVVVFAVGQAKMTRALNEFAQAMGDEEPPPKETESRVTEASSYSEMLRSTTASSATIETARSRVQPGDTARASRTIRKTARLLIGALLGLLCVGMVYFVVASDFLEPAGVRAFSPPGKLSAATAVSEVLAFTLLGLVVVLQRWARRQTALALRPKTETPLASQVVAPGHTDAAKLEELRRRYMNRKTSADTVTRAGKQVDDSDATGSCDQDPPRDLESTGSGLGTSLSSRGPGRE